MDCRKYLIIFIKVLHHLGGVRTETCKKVHFINSLSASLLLNISLSFEVGIAHAIANFK